MLVSANLATYHHPERTANLRKAVDSIYDQVDVLRVCLNGYQTVPKYLKRPKIEAHIPEQDLGASGKFLWACNPNEQYFSVDDDILYPSDYVERYVRALEKYDNRVIVTSHGSIPKPVVRNFFRDRIVFHFLEPMHRDCRVDVGGTGVMAFCTNLLQIDRREFVNVNMADLHLAKIAQEHDIRIICLAHEKHWLDSLETTENIYSTYCESGKKQAEILHSFLQRSIWDRLRYESIRVRNRLDALRRAYEGT